MATSYSRAFPATVDGEIAGEALRNLRLAVGPGAPVPYARLRLAEMDLAICDGAGLALYSLRFGASAIGWEQRAIAYPAVEELRALREDRRWDRRARRACLRSPSARTARVGVGIVAAEARAAEQAGALDDGEETVYRLSEALAAHYQALGSLAAKAGRLHTADVERARRPSHVPLRRFQDALAEELALGHSAAALCSRSPRFSDSADESKVITLLCRRLGLLAHRDPKGRRYARVAASETAERLCEALDLAPEEVEL
jgi:hypothetical protein